MGYCYSNLALLSPRALTIISLFSRTSGWKKASIILFDEITRQIFWTENKPWLFHIRWLPHPIFTRPSQTWTQENRSSKQVCRVWTIQPFSTTFLNFLKDSLSKTCIFYFQCKQDLHLQGGMGRAAKKGGEGSVIMQISSVRSFVTSR